MEQELKGVSDAELLKSMEILSVNRHVDGETLKRAYQREIKLHHTDKGGEDDAAKAVTTSYRLLKLCLESGRRLPSKKIQLPITVLHTRSSSNKMHTASAHNNNTSTATASNNSESHKRSTQNNNASSKTAPSRRRRVFPYYTIEDSLGTSFFCDWDDEDMDPFHPRMSRLSREFGDLFAPFPSANRSFVAHPGGHHRHHHHHPMNRAAQGFFADTVFFHEPHGFPF
jgi:hypothetical protein